MSLRQRSWTVVAIALTTAGAACQPSEQGPTFNTAQMMMETRDLIDGIHSELAILQSEIDSLRTELATQDSLIRVMFNLQGNPLPPRPIIPPD